jgi:hypothetical protein
MLLSELNKLTFELLEHYGDIQIYTDTQNALDPIQVCVYMTKDNNKEKRFIIIKGFHDTIGGG